MVTSYIQFYESKDKKNKEALWINIIFIVMDQL